MLGLFHPLGPIGTLAPMTVAAGTVHWGKPIWVTSGGVELPLTSLAIALALMLGGPGRFALDRALGINLPAWLLAPAALLIGAGVADALTGTPEPDGGMDRGAPSGQARATTRPAASG